MDAINLADFIKPLPGCKDFVPPCHLSYGQSLEATPITRTCSEEDFQAVSNNIDIIRRTRGGRWPSDTLTKADNFLDLAWHEREQKSGTSFAYALRDKHGIYIGCFYLKPLGIRTTMDLQLLRYDVDVSWWVTEPAYRAGHYTVVYHALQHWIAEAFPFITPFFSNIEIPLILPMWSQTDFLRDVVDA